MSATFGRVLSSRTPLDDGYAKIELGPYFLPGVQSPADVPPTAQAVNVAVSPASLTIGDERLVGDDFYFEIQGGVAGLLYTFTLSIQLDDGQTFARSVYQRCLSRV